MSKRQETVKSWLKEAKKIKITSAYLAKKLNMSLQNFYYHINESPELDLDIFNQVKTELKKFIDLPGSESEILLDRDCELFFFSVKYQLVWQK